MMFQNVLVYFILVNMVYTNYFMILYRLIKMFGDYKDSVFRSRFNFLALMTVIYIGATVAIMSPMSNPLMSREEIYNATLVFDRGIADFLLTEPSVFGYPPAFLIRVQQYSIVILVTAVIIIIIITRTVIRKIIETKVKKTRTDKTYQMTVRF
jgi:hypothetical protein